MCGNWISNPIGSAKKVISDPLGWGEKHLGDIASAAALAMGQPELIPLTEGLGNAASTKLQGGSWGDALKSGVTSGALSYVGGQAMNGLSNLASTEFPATMDSISSGLGQAKSAIFGSPAVDSAASGLSGTIDPGFAQAVDASGDSVAMNSPDAVNFGNPTASGSVDPFSSAAAKTGTNVAGGKSFTPWYTADDLGVGNVPGLRQVANFTGAHPYLTLGAGGLALAASSSASAAQKQKEQNAAALAAQNAKDKSLNETWQAMLRQQPLQRTLNPNNSSVDYANYGAGPEHLFYDDVNPPYSVPVQIAQTSSNNGPRAYAKGGAVKVSKSLPVTQGPVKAKPATGGQADKIPANLSQDEHVIPADVVAHLGDGSSDAGHEVLQKLIMAVRNQKTKAGTKLPPPAKSPTKYMEA